MFLGQKFKAGFTLIEIMVGVLIVSILMTGGFYALTSINIGKIKLIESTNMEKEMFYFSEKLYEIIKKGGVVDYEEYFNRQTYNQVFSGGKYLNKSGFGNGGTVMWYCASPDGSPNSLTGGCLSASSNSSGSTIDHVLSANKLLYGQYGYQFIDYNSNRDDDLGDEDGDNNIVGDIDDEFVGLGPEAFSGSGKVYEVYLINGEKTKRTYFRWNVMPDPNRGSAACTLTSGSPVGSNPVGSGCLGNIEILKLEGKDIGRDHDNAIVGQWQNDGIIDTWLYDKEFYGLTSDIIADYPTSNSNSYWVPLFPDTMSVMNVEFFLFPNKDIKLAWKDFSSNINMTPYLRIKFTLSPSWKKRKGMQGNPPSFDFSTTLSLTDIFSK